MIHHDFSYSYQYRNGDWQIINEDQCYSNFSSSHDLKIGEYNVLFGMPNKILDKFARNQKRFNYILNTIIPSCDPDILSLMEVTQEFMDLLLQNQNIRDNYYISHAQKSYPRRLFEVVIISKQPFSTIYAKDHKQGRYQYSIFPNRESWKSFMVISTHLWAGEHDFKSREKQLQLIDQSLKDNSYLNGNKITSTQRDVALKANSLNNIILQGDLNLHMRHEDSFIYNNGFIDAYREIYPNEEGYTWDPVHNNYINSVFLFDNRRMRLDRILIRKNCNLFTISNVEILGKEKIGIGLAASDHFLLLSHLSMNSSPQPLVQNYDTSNIVLEQNTGFRPLSKIIKIRIGVGIGIICGIVALAVGIPLFVIYF